MFQLSDKDYTMDGKLVVPSCVDEDGVEDDIDQSPKHSSLLNPTLMTGLGAHFKFNFMVESFPRGPAEQVEKTVHPVPRNGKQSLIEVRKDILKDVFREGVLDGTASAIKGIVDDQSPTTECNNNDAISLPWRGNQSLIKVKKDLSEDIFKDAIIYKFKAPIAIDEEEGGLVQSPEIEFKFTDLVSIGEEEDDLDQSPAINLSREEVEETENPGTVPRTGKQFLLRLRTDIFKEGVASLSSLDMNTPDSLTSSSVILSTPSQGLRDLNNSQSEDQIMLEDGDMRRQLRKKQRFEERKLKQDVRSLSEGIVEKRRKIAQLEEEIISDQSELDRKEKLRISRQKEENQPNRYCDLCNVKANGEITWQDHLNGKKHRMGKLELEKGEIVIL